MRHDACPVGEVAVDDDGPLGDGVHTHVLDVACESVNSGIEAQRERVEILGRRGAAYDAGGYGLRLVRGEGNGLSVGVEDESGELELQ